jgi:hypothetical protein
VARPVAVWLVAAMFGLAACGGNGSAEPSTTTSVAPSSTLSSTSTTTTTTTTTVLVPPTTISPLDAEKAKVEAAYRAAAAAHQKALSDPDMADPDALRAVIANGRLLDAELKLIDDLKREGRRVKPNDPSVREFTVEALSLVAANATSAQLVVCAVNNDVLYEPGSDPGPDDDVVINDSFIARRLAYDMIKDGETWKELEYTLSGEWPGASACPPP